MYGNGVKIGKVLTVAPHRLILLVLIVGLNACSVVVAGSTQPGTVAHHTVTSLHLISEATPSGSA